MLSIYRQAVLHFMTGYTSTEEGAAVSQDVVKVLVLSGLMKWFVLKNELSLISTVSVT